MKTILKIPYIHIDSVDEYFALPNKEREYCGLYRKPMALPAAGFFRKYSKHNNDGKGWLDWENQIKKDDPIQWFFREYVTSTNFPPALFAKRIKWKVDGWYHNTKRFLNPVHPRFQKAYPRWIYSDITEAIVRINFALILDFWHEEIVDGCVDWESDCQHKKFYKYLEKYVDWIENSYKITQDAEFKAMCEGNDSDLPYEEAYKESHRLEKLIEDKETEILTWMLKNRKYFWS